MTYPGYDSDESYELNNDLNEALSSGFDFNGDFYHCSTDPDAPDPGLSIKGLGAVSLPLSKAAAKSIISCAAQAPFGKGEATVVDKSVRDTWEIEPSQVSFTNRKWKSYVDKLASKTIWTALGVAPWAKKPKCELYKLLLYQPGSHFLPHQDTVKAGGMFATVVIVLPSAFKGGQVHVTHAGSTKILDVSASSKNATSVLAWYTDVLHEVKPITSGYRLALSYNLIHTSPNIPRPSLSSMHSSVAALRRPLQKWLDDEYEETPSVPLLAYVLAHEYSPDNIAQGVEALKGKDAHMVAHLLPVAAELGFAVCLANLKRTVSGSADDEGGYRYERSRMKRRRRRYYDSDEEEEEEYDDDDWDSDPCAGEDPPMGEIGDITNEVSNLGRLDGGKAIDLGSFEIGEDSLVPCHAFDGKKPDDSEYEGYMGNGAGALSQWYERSVMILFKKEDETSLILSAKGPVWALERIPKKSKKPTPAAETIISAVLDDLDKAAGRKSWERPRSGGRFCNHEDAVVVLAHAVRWGRFDIWSRAVAHVGPVSDEKKEEVVRKALEAFEVEKVKPGITKLMAACSSLKSKMGIIDTVQSCLEDEVEDQWIEELKKEALTSYQASSVDDIPILLGLDFNDLQTLVLPNIAKTGSFKFLLALTRALIDHTSSTEDDTDTASTLNPIIRQCLLSTFAKWGDEVPDPHAPSWEKTRTRPMTLQESQQRLEELIDISFSVDPSLCVDVFNAAGEVRYIQVLGMVQRRLGSGKVPGWFGGLVSKVLATYRAGDAADIPTLIWIARLYGARHLRKSELLARSPRQGTYSFFESLARELHKYRLDASNDPAKQKIADEYAKAATLSLKRAISQWEYGTDTPAPAHYYYNHHRHRGYRVAVPVVGMHRQPQVQENLKVKRVLTLIELCFDIGGGAGGDLSPCTDLLNLVLVHPQPNNAGRSTLAERYKQLYKPLVPKLKEFLVQRGFKHTASRTSNTGNGPNFKAFFHTLISRYLEGILGPVRYAPAPTLPSTRVGCSPSCTDCQKLSTFITSPSQEIQFKAVQKIRAHLEAQLSRCPEPAVLGRLVTWHTVRTGSPQTLVVRKRAEVIPGLQWHNARQDALAFLASVGTDAELREIMGGRYQDVAGALRGVRFVVASAAQGQRVVAAVPATSRSSLAQPGGSSSRTETAKIGQGVRAPSSGSGSRSRVQAPAPVAGVKRKHGTKEPPRNVVAYFDLT